MKARTLERKLKRQLSRLLALVLRPRPATPEAIAAMPVTRLLVIRQHNQMGDMVLALPALSALRRAFGGAHLTFVAGPLSDQLLRGHPDIDELIVYRRSEMFRPWGLWRFVRRLRRLEPQLAVVLGTVSFSVTSALLAWSSGARLRTGLSSRPWGSELSGALYNFEIEPPQSEAHEVEHNLNFVRALGIEAPHTWPRLEPTEDARASAQAFLRQAFPGHEGPVLVMHVGAGKASNLWPVERFAEAAHALVEQLGARVVVTEGPRDRDAVSSFRQRVPEAAHWQNDLGRTLGILSGSNLYIGNDTGMSHVAAATGISCVVVFGPHDARRWSPAGPCVRVVTPQSGRIEDVSVHAVVDAAMNALASSRNAH